VTWSDPTVRPSRLAISSRLSPSATSSLIFSIACGVNLTRLPLADELAFVIVWFFHFFPCGHSVSAAGLLYGLLRPRAAQAVGNQAQLALKEFDPCEHRRLLPRPYLSSAASISSASRSGLSPSYSTLVSGCRRGGSLLEVDVMTRDVRSPSFANC